METIVDYAQQVFRCVFLFYLCSVFSVAYPLRVTREILPPLTTSFLVYFLPSV